MFFRSKGLRKSLSKVSKKLDITQSEQEQSTGDLSIQPSDKQTPPSIISSDVHLVGQINSDGEVQIDGSFEGDIRTKVLLVGKTGMIKGEVLAQTVHIHGSVNGHVKARDVNLAKTAHVIGNILHENMSIETGAFLEGNCKSLEANENGEVDVFETKPADSKLNEIKNENTKNNKVEILEQNDKNKTQVL
jgi:cytoskeletal protein CcmA (bactofilin family)